MKQIFVRGLSRSGGTLMVTVLDAHPHVAMSYEIYEHLLAPTDAEKDPLQKLMEITAPVKKSILRRIVGPQQQKSTVDTFAARAQRSGLEPDALHALAHQHQSLGLDFSTFESRVRFVERCAIEKMNREHKQHWGVKSDSNYDDLFELYPDACFLFMQRDGRDMAASRKLTGNFKQSVEHIAKTWCDQMSRFEEFSNRPGVRARFVNYERLTADPESELRDVLEFLELPWDDRVLNFQNEDLTIYKNPMGHLSAEQVNKPINTSSVGRWKRDLSPGELAAFEAVACHMLAKLGYEVSLAQMAGDP
jgi:hypothetical protein